MMKPLRFDTQLQVLITSDMNKALKVAAVNAGLRQADYVRQAIREKLQKDRNVMEVPL
jgi:hypothetical protein